jgi:hypothetical protein
MNAALEIDTVLAQFKHNILRAIEAEVRRQIVANLDAVAPTVVEPAPKVKGKRGPKEGSIAKEKPCPTCGTMNKARRFRFYCADHRDQIPARAA